MGKRHRARELALQILYQLDIREERSEQILQEFWEENDTEKDVRNFANTLVKGLRKKG